MSGGRFVALAILGSLGFVSCKGAQRETSADAPRGATPTAPAAPAAATPTSATLVSAPDGTLFPTGVVLRGDRASLQHFLRYVDTVVGARVRVTYAPQTVYVDRDAAIRALHSATWDGVTWRFDATEPVVQRLRPGSVLLVWGLAIRRVNRVDRDGDEIVVTTQEAQLTDAVTDASISWDAPAHLRQGAIAIRVPRKEDSVKFVGRTRGPSSTASSLRFASLVAQDTTAEDPPALYQQSFKVKVGSYGVAMAYGAAAEDTLNFYAQFGYGEDVEEPVSLPPDLAIAEKYGNKFADWLKKQQEQRDKDAKAAKARVKEIRDEGKITSGNGPGLKSPIPKTSEEQQKQKEEEEDAQAEYEKKYGKPSRNSVDGKPKLPEMPKMPSSWKEGVGTIWKELTARTAFKVTTAGTVTGFKSKGDIQIEGGLLKSARLENPDFHLIADIHWAARIDLAVFAGRTKVEVPVTFRAPLIIGGLPAFFEVGVNALIAPALTSKHATAKGSRHIDFQKGASFTITPSSVSGESGDPDATAEKGEEDGVSSLGVSGLMVALQVPRIALGFGIIGSNITGYYDVVVASNSTHTGATGILHCTHSQVLAGFDVGVSASFLGFPLGDQRKTGPNKKWEWDDPPGMSCK
ncbi:MAG: hypothetical protein ABJD07_13745 [Gemmatimonadaceae bacterium]